MASSEVAGLHLGNKELWPSGRDPGLLLGQLLCIALPAGRLLARSEPRTVAGPLLQNLTTDKTLAIFGHPVKGTLGADGLPIASDGLVMRLSAIGQCRCQRAGKRVREGSSIKAFAPVMRSDWQAHADHDFEASGGPLGPVNEQ